MCIFYWISTNFDKCSFRVRFPQGPFLAKINISERKIFAFLIHYSFAHFWSCSSFAPPPLIRRSSSPVFMKHRPHANVVWSQHRLGGGNLAANHIQIQSKSSIRVTLVIIKHASFACGEPGITRSSFKAYHRCGIHP